MNAQGDTSSTAMPLSWKRYPLREPYVVPADGFYAVKINGDDTASIAPSTEGDR